MSNDLTLSEAIQDSDPVTKAKGLARLIPEMGVIGTFLVLFSVILLAGGWFIRTDFLTTTREQREDARDERRDFLKCIQDNREEFKRINDANVASFERVTDVLRSEHMETRAALLQSNAHLGAALQELKAVKQAIPARPPMPSKD